MTLVNVMFRIQNVAIINLSYHKDNYDSFCRIVILKSPPLVRIL